MMVIMNSGATDADIAAVRAKAKELGFKNGKHPARDHVLVSIDHGDGEPDLAPFQGLNGVQEVVKLSVEVPSYGKTED